MLILPIKRKWFDMILSGEKKEEYQCQQDKEERTWQDHIMDRFMRRI